MADPDVNSLPIQGLHHNLPMFPRPLEVFIKKIPKTEHAENHTDGDRNTDASYHGIYNDMMFYWLEKPPDVGVAVHVHAK